MHVKECFECKDATTTITGPILPEQKQKQFLCETCKEKVPEQKLYIISGEFNPNVHKNEKWIVQDLTAIQIKEFKELNDNEAVEQLRKQENLGEHFSIIIRNKYVNSELENARNEVKKRKSDLQYNHSKIISRDI